MRPSRPTDSSLHLTERFMALFIDVVIAVGLSMFPRIGWIVGLIYFLAKDAIPAFDGQSIGKKFFNLKVITSKTHQPLTKHPERSLIRSIVFLLPIVNIIDIYRLISNGERLADKWAETTLIKLPAPDDEEAAQ